MTVATIGAVVAAVWGISILYLTGLCVHAGLVDRARADDLLPTDTWEPATETAICEALAVAEDDFWLWQVENGWASA